MKLEPLHDRVLVKRIPEPESKSLILIPEAYQKKSMLAKVLSVGPGAWRDGYFCKTAVKPGDTVLLPGFGGQNPDWEGEQELLIQEGDIGAIVG